MDEQHKFEFTDESTKLEFPEEFQDILNNEIINSQGSESAFAGLWDGFSRGYINSVVDDMQLDGTTISYEENQEETMLIGHDALQANLQANLDSTTMRSENNQQDAIVIEQHGVREELQANNNIVVPAELPIQIPTVGSNVYQGSSSLPASENWPGDYNFTVSFSPQPKTTKGVSWTYSRMKDKLYVGKDAPCPVNFSANTKLPNDVYVRVMALYTSPEQVNEIVQRCINHSMDDMNEGKFEARHLIRCESATAAYHVDAITKRHSVVVPFENPSAGQHYSTYIYKFACFGSCAGGPNRRPLMLIFTLERGNQVIGRRKLDIKICACPGRDKKADEAQHISREQIPNQRSVSPLKRKLNSEPVLLSEVMDFTRSLYLPLPKKKSKVAPNKDGDYVLTTKNWECYEFLRQMKKVFEISEAMKNISPEVLSTALHAQKSKRKE